MKLNFNFELKDLNDRNVLDQEGNSVKANIFLANMLAQLSKGDSIKLIEIALKLNKGEELELDTSDKNTIKQLIEESGINNIVKYRLLTVF